MDDYRIWSPLSKVESQKYLYHYTTYETALKILYYRTLRFSGLSRTNDAFEQRPKLKCQSTNLEVQQIFRSIKATFKEQQEKIRILCFSMDPDFSEFSDQYEKMKKYLSKDQLRENVNGRGFALPRMWAQYANNNTGVCLVFNKELLEKCFHASGIKFIGKKVTYLEYYEPFEMDEDGLKSISQILSSKGSMPIINFIKENVDFVDYNYFRKLSDWAREYEYRYITFQNGGNQREIEAQKIQNCLCGVVLGGKIGEVEKKIIELLLFDQESKVPLKQIHYDDLTTRLSSIKYRKSEFNPD